MRRAKRLANAGLDSAGGEGAGAERGAARGTVGAAMSRFPKLGLDKHPHGSRNREDRISGFPLRKASALTLAYSAAALLPLARSA